MSNVLLLVILALCVSVVIAWGCAESPKKTVVHVTDDVTITYEIK